MKKILIRGYFNNNFGDDLLIYVLVKRYPKCKFIICSPNKYSKDTFRSKNILIINRYIVKIVNKISNIIKKPQVTCNNIVLRLCDAMILLGGSIFIENNSLEIEKKFLDEIFLYNNKKIYIIGSNFGPYKNKKYFNLCKNYFKDAEDICFRDKQSYALFNNMENVRLGTDVVFSMKKEINNKISKKSIVISVIDLSFRDNLKYKLEDYEKKLCEITRHFIDEKYNVILMSFCRFEGDEKAVKRVYDRLGENYQKNTTIYNYKSNVSEVMKIISESTIVVASRYHAMVLGLLFKKKVIPIVYSDKMLNTIRDINFKGQYIMISNIAEFNINNFSKVNKNYIFDLDNINDLFSLQFKKLDEFLGEK